jgi:hypothetical protein
VDPNACLERFLNALSDGDYREAFEARRELANWLKNGGFAPDWTPESRSAFDNFRTLPAFTPLGSYPLLYVHLGEGLCACCATSVGLSEHDADVLWEGNGYDCDQCGETVESAYGSEDDDRDPEDVYESAE